MGPLTLSIPLQLQLEKHKGEILGVVVVESGWGSILPTVILANMMNGGPAARSGKLSIGDQIMSINGTSLVGLPLATCQGIIKVSILGPSAQQLFQPCLTTYEDTENPEDPPGD
jgi:C-terminal processing protease CtpA/Prc